MNKINPHNICAFCTGQFLHSSIWQYGNTDNLALEESNPKTRSFDFYQKKASSTKQVDLRDMFKKAFKSVCTSNIVVSSSLLSYSMNFFCYEESMKHRRRPWWPWTSRWRRYQNWIFLWLVVQLMYWNSNKKLHVST